MIINYQAILHIIELNAGVTEESIKKYYLNFKINKFKKLVPAKKLKVFQCSQGHKHICFTKGIFTLSNWSKHEHTIGNKMRIKYAL